jgi:prolyl-tRNA editing enzyme YbaK/EbsC (Cys-tRNA(Pro) deacylase)
MSETPHVEVTTRGAAALVEYLEGRNARFELIEHAATESAAREADSVGWERAAMAKTLVLHDGARHLLAVVPASQRLDLNKLRAALGDRPGIRLATEDEIASDFPALVVGATPPVGPMLPVAEVIDRRLLEQSRILCAGGDHRHSIALDPHELVRLTDARVADISSDD